VCRESAELEGGEKKRKRAKTKRLQEAKYRGVFEKRHGGEGAKDTTAPLNVDLICLIEKGYPQGNGQTGGEGGGASDK